MEERFAEAKSKCVRYARSIARVLGVGPDFEFDRFYGDIPALGVWESFKKLLFDLGIHNSGYENNLDLIHCICLAGDDECFDILKRVRVVSGSYSVNLQVGKNPEKIKIMTVHASKGLEFSHVVLGGIHTNGLSPAQNISFGKQPFSLKWRESVETQKPFRSPNFIHESLVAKKKDFSESKRLLYVACTRARESLSWVDIRLNGKDQAFSKNSWIQGIRIWEKLDPSQAERLLNRRELTETKPLPEHPSKGHGLPFLHQDSLGIQTRPKASTAMITSPELSVTKLAYLADCPKKFYFGNILKLPPGKFSSASPSPPSETPASSLRRGVNIHQILEKALKGGAALPPPGRDRRSVEWVLGQLESYRDSHRAVSEEESSFPSTA